MNDQIIGIKQLQTHLKHLTQQVQEGSSFVVVKNSKPVFRIEPIEGAKTKRYTLTDLKKLQFRSGTKNLSKSIDKIIYGV
ncbi:MAG: hypothetical protein AAB400_04825 [Patescibacteria group bacterium]